MPYLADTLIQSGLRCILASSTLHKYVNSLGIEPLILVLLVACLRYMITSLRIFRDQNPGEHIGSSEEKVKAETRII